MPAPCCMQVECTITSKFSFVLIANHSLYLLPTDCIIHHQRFHSDHCLRHPEQRAIQNAALIPRLTFKFQIHIIKTFQRLSKMNSTIVNIHRDYQEHLEDNLEQAWHHFHSFQSRYFFTGHRQREK